MEWVKSLTGNATPDEKNTTILIVDDDRITRHLLRRHLERDGYTVIEAADGAEALSAFESQQPEVVMMDCMMPVMDGFTACSRLRQLPGGDKATVLMITGLDDHRSMDLAIESGATEFVTKPIHWKTMSQRVRNLLRARQTEVLLDQSVAGAKTIVSHVLDGIVTIDAGNLIKSFNPAAKRIFGYQSDEVFGKNIKSLMPGAIRGEDIIAGERMVRENIKFSASREITGLRKDGSTFPLELTISGFPAGERLLTVRDLTELRIAENKLRLAAKVFESITEGIIVTDARMIIQSVNPAFTTLTGYDEEEVDGKNLDIIVSEQTLSDVIREDWGLKTKTGHWQGEIGIRRRGGEIILAWMIISAIRGEDYQAEQYVAVFRDITERERIGEDRRRLHEQAARMQRLSSLSAMSAGISHEINQPLNSIKILTDGMLYWHKRGRSPGPEKIMENLQKISAQVGRINEIIKYMRSFVSSGQATRVEPCSLVKAVNAALGLLSQQLSSHGICISRELPGDLPEVLANPNRLEEVVINLLTNAMQALDVVDNAEKEISCCASQAGENVVLEIADNATGISDEIKDSIFEPLISTKHSKSGMGLGLSIVQTIVASFNGKIEAINNEKGGATFRMELPIFSDLAGGEHNEHSPS